MFPDAPTAKGQLLIVVDIYPWGVKAMLPYESKLGIARYYYRLAHGDYVVIGKCKFYKDEHFIERDLNGCQAKAERRSRSRSS